MSSDGARPQADVPINNEDLLNLAPDACMTTEGGEDGDDQHLLSSLGIEHASEASVSKRVLDTAQARWAAAAAKQKDKARKKQSRGAPAKRDRGLDRGRGGDAASASPTAFSVRVAEARQKQQVRESKSESEGSRTAGEESESQEEEQLGSAGRKGPQDHRALKSVLRDESSRIRFGDLTPFEEKQLVPHRPAEKPAGEDRIKTACAGTGPSQQRIPRRSNIEGGGPPSSATSPNSHGRPGSRPGVERGLSAGGRSSGSAVKSHPVAGSISQITRPRIEQVCKSLPDTEFDGLKEDGGSRTIGSERTGPDIKLELPAQPIGRHQPDVKDGARSGQGSVQCPMCQQPIAVKNLARPDADLSLHLDQCIAGGSSEPVAPRRSRRKRRRVLSSEESSEEDRYKSSDVPRASTEGQPVNNQGLMEFADSQTESEDSDVEGLVEEAEVLEAPHGIRMKQCERTKRAAKAVRTERMIGRTTFLVDDFVEEDYYRRLEDIEAAWSQEGREGAEENRARHEGLEEGEQQAGPLELPGGFVIPAKINRRLYWYQRTGVRWLWELYRQGAGGILGDEMGLGKTVQLAAFLSGLRRSGNLKSALIIAPATLMSQWTTELFTWAPRLRVVVLHRSAAAYAAQPVHKVGRFVRRAASMDGVVCLTTYESLKLLRDQLLNQSWSYVALDEGQKIRNPDAEVTLCAKQLATVHRLILSGTPIQNNLRELWSLFDFCFPGRLGTLPAFEQELATPIRMGGYSNATPTQAQLAYRCALVLRDLIHPYLLRRAKKDIMTILVMPKKTEQVLFCKLTSRQRNLYRAVISSPEIRLILEGKASHFRAITTLRKICNHADLVAGPNESGQDIMARLVTGGGWLDDWEDELEKGDAEGREDQAALEVGQRVVSKLSKRVTMADYGAADRSGKLQVLMEILPRWKKQGHRVLIFSQTVMMLDILERLVKECGWDYLRMDGSTNVGSRPALIDRFNNDERHFCFLLTTRTGGLGISLTGADRVVLYDPDWNPQTDIQARERAWRLGQKRPVTIYRLVTTGTIEEKIYQRQIFKTAITNRVLQDPKQKRLFSAAELKELFSLKEDFDDEEAPNETADVFMEGMVKRSEAQKWQRKGKRARTGQREPVERASSSIVAVEEDQGPGAGRGTGIGFEKEGEKGTGHEGEEDDCKILKAVFGGRGIASVLSHDVVETGKMNTQVWMQAQDQARKVAERAARTLRESAANVAAAQRECGNLFMPTWTGRVGTAGQAPRFGPAAGARLSTPSVDGTRGFELGQRVVGSSAAILSRFREREGGRAGDVYAGEEERYLSLMDQVKCFLQEKGPGVSTEEVLHKFRHVPQQDAITFKACLKEVACLQRGKWYVKENQ